MSMDLEALQQQADAGIRRFETRHEGKEEDELLFHYLNKINEDIGDLSSSVMGGSKPHKTFAEALYSIMMLAKKMDVDIAQAMREKLQEVAMEAEQEALL